MAVALSLQDTRVEDYLNDKLQTNADLESLDGLLRDVQHQQSLLKEQVYFSSPSVNGAADRFICALLALRSSRDRCQKHRSI